MSILLELPETLERHLRDEAARSGITLNNQILKKLDVQPQNAPVHMDGESELLFKIKNWVPDHQHKRYYELVDKRVNKTIQDSDYQELLMLTDLIEIAHAVRLKHLFDLAKLKNMDILALMNDLDIQHLPYD
jgi:hypothetical protein